MESNSMLIIRALTSALGVGTVHISIFFSTFSLTH